MSYIPDYRDEKNIALLNSEDKMFLRGYSAAIEAAQNILDDIELDEDEREEGMMLLECQEIEAYCGIIESADYIPDDAVVDVNPKMYVNTKGDKNNE